MQMQQLLMLLSGMGQKHQQYLPGGHIKKRTGLGHPVFSRLPLQLPHGQAEGFSPVSCTGQ